MVWFSLGASDLWLYFDGLYIYIYILEHRKTNLWLLICSYILMVLGHDLGHKECLVGVRCFVLPFSELELFSTTFPFRIELSFLGVKSSHMGKVF